MILYKGHNYDLFSNAMTIKKYALNGEPEQGSRNEDLFEVIRNAIERRLNVKPIIDFGTNYAEFYHDGTRAVQKLLNEKQGQVAGAFYKEDLGDIDLVWGDSAIGLKKIIEKHLDDFKIWGEGQEGLIKGINEIIESGKLIDENGIKTIWHKKGDDYYLVGLSKGFNGKGKNLWVITSYHKTNPSDKQRKYFDSSSEALSANTRFNKL
ncbi:MULTISPECIES: hypothetical protein [unclassified Helicobacter]|uniref:putative barnase/colicin E5 family endoribonuclease n=1 Tax=unclassified Helicobacter TaxID=2593540 RepID=UPI00115FBBD1|nr:MULTISPECIES: hypothetical protein [unclassified Helicobacter]